MERLLGRKFWFWPITSYMGLLIWAGEDVGRFVFGNLSGRAWFDMIAGADPDWRKWAAVPITALFILLYLKPVWRFLWRVPWFGRLCSDKVFPDLNGDWDVEMQSNWPMINKMQAAAANPGEPYDINRLEKPEFASVEKLVAKIDQSWVHLSMLVRSENPQSRIEASHTVSFDLIRKSGNKPHQLAYVYAQGNRLGNQPYTDEKGFLGAAMLDVSDDAKTLTGVYFTNRNWQKGMGTGGTVVMRKRGKG